MYNTSLFIFRRDLRLVDNTAWLKCSKYSKKIIPCFIINPEQVGSSNRFRSDPCIQFMIESLEDLDKELKKYGGKLNVLYGDDDGVITKIIKKYKIDALFTNQDYTNYARIREEKIQQICEKRHVAFKIYEDIMLVPIGENIKTGSGSSYSKFTPYYNVASKKKIPKPIKSPDVKKKLVSIENDITWSKMHKLYSPLPKIHVHGGRENGLKILRNLKKDISNYEKTHNVPHIKTSNLSAYNKFGCISIREVYYFAKKLKGINRKAFIRQLYWRDFYYYLVWHFPHVLSELKNNRNFKKSYSKVHWFSLIKGVKPTAEAKKQFLAWQKGETGFPLVDAGMRQLNQTGYMHNRVRLVVGNFLTRDLHWNWEDGELYFAQHLVDYDPAQNNGNWQWISGSGVDSQPYFRIFNPWTQSKTLDSEAEYIKKWIPELKNVPAEDIHNWNVAHLKYKKCKYPAPILDHDTEKNKALTFYKKAY